MIGGRPARWERAVRGGTGRHTGRRGDGGSGHRGRNTGLTPPPAFDRSCARFGDILSCPADAFAETGARVSVAVANLIARSINRR
jgi:hypothetical protein